MFQQDVHEILLQCYTQTQASIYHDLGYVSSSSLDLHAELKWCSFRPKTPNEIFTSAQKSKAYRTSVD